MEVSASRPSRFISVERFLGTHWKGGWVDPRAGLDAVEKKRSLAPAGSQTPAVQLVASR
jgi:hypothetical protein